VAVRRLLAQAEVAPFALERVAGGAPQALASPPKARLERKGTRVRVRLEGTGAWEEQLERWSVGAPVGKALRTAWTAYRTQRERALPHESPWLASRSAKLVVEVVDVLGRTKRIVPSRG